MSDKGGKGLDKNGQMMTLGTDLGNVWEMFGKCLELSYPVNQ